MNAPSLNTARRPPHPDWIDEDEDGAPISIEPAPARNHRLVQLKLRWFVLRFWLERCLLERVVHGRGPEEGSTMIASDPEHHSLSGFLADLQTTGIAAVPATTLIAVFAACNVRFVEAGWPLFAILWLGVFAGVLAALGRASHPKSR